MKDATHHLKQLQRKILQAAKKSESAEIAHETPNKNIETKWEKSLYPKKK